MRRRNQNSLLRLRKLYLPRRRRNPIKGKLLKSQPQKTRTRDRRQPRSQLPKLRSQSLLESKRRRLNQKMKAKKRRKSQNPTVWMDLK